MRIIELNENEISNILNDLLKRSPNNYGEYEGKVKEILENVKEKGDAALFEYTKNFDKADINEGNILVTEEEIQAAYDSVDSSLVEVIKKAIKNIREYHEKQRQYSWFDSKPDGSMLGQKVTALSRAVSAMCTGSWSREAWIFPPWRRLCWRGALTVC